MPGGPGGLPLGQGEPGHFVDAGDGTAGRGTSSSRRSAPPTHGCSGDPGHVARSQQLRRIADDNARKLIFGAVQPQWSGWVQTVTE
jgi:hypothetical protein